MRWRASRSSDIGGVPKGVKPVGFADPALCRLGCVGRPCDRQCVQLPRPRYIARIEGPIE